MLLCVWCLGLASCGAVLCCILWVENFISPGCVLLGENQATRTGCALSPVLVCCCKTFLHTIPWFVLSCSMCALTSLPGLLQKWILRSPTWSFNVFENRIRTAPGGADAGHDKTSAKAVLLPEMRGSIARRATRERGDDNKERRRQKRSRSPPLPKSHIPLPRFWQNTCGDTCE